MSRDDVLGRRNGDPVVYAADARRGRGRRRRAGPGLFGGLILSALRHLMTLEALEAFARRKTAVGADEALLLQDLELGVDDVDCERRAATAVHALLHVAIDDARRRDRRLGLVQDVEQSELDIEVGDLLAGTNDHE